MEEEKVPKLLKVNLQRLAAAALRQQQVWAVRLDALDESHCLALFHLDADLLEGVHQLALVNEPVIVEVNVLEEDVQLLLILQAVGDKLGKVNVPVGVPVGALNQVLQDYKKKLVNSKQNIKKLITKLKKAKWLQDSLVSFLSPSLSPCTHIYFVY